jgi:hypothetical protein
MGEDMEPGDSGVWVNLNDRPPPGRVLFSIRLGRRTIPSIYAARLTTGTTCARRGQCVPVDLADNVLPKEKLYLVAAPALKPIVVSTSLDDPPRLDETIRFEAVFVLYTIPPLSITASPSPSPANHLHPVLGAIGMGWCQYRFER